MDGDLEKEEEGKPIQNILYERNLFNIKKIYVAELLKMLHIHHHFLSYPLLSWRKEAGKSQEANETYKVI